MILTAPGRELYLEAGRLKAKPERVRALLLIFLLPILAVLLWSIRKNVYVLIVGGGAMAVGFFYIYFMLYERRDRILDFFVRLFAPFYKVFEKHREAAGWGAGNAAGKAAGQAGGKNRESKGDGGSQAGTGREDEYFRRWKEAAGKARQEKEREQNRREEEWRKRRREYTKRKAGGEKSAGSGSGKKNVNTTDSARAEAETIFMVKYPYDEAEIKSKRNLLLKKYHPDNPEGSEEMCKKINECYALLMKYCG
ncbi:MAG: hypothetical protein K5686_06525 [Lachnospiraceae bacterium]|nr:hypothetical protein [Lachnospiraceae bacterium]